MKTYVFCDLHGDLERYTQLLKTIAFSDEDRAYVLGDVIDRGPNGVEILLDIMHRRNITLLMGNHENMMLRVMHGREKYSSQYREDRKLWKANGCDPTMNGLRRLSSDQQRELQNYLESLPLIFPELHVGSRCFCLVHGRPPVATRERFLEVFTQHGGHISAGERAYDSQYYWGKIESGDHFYEDRILLFGHTPTIHYQSGMPMRFWKQNEMIGLDCGCGYPGGQLGCLCLDDMSETYI